MVQSHTETASEMYDIVFEAALSMFRACRQTGDPMGLAMSQALFSVANEWEKQPERFPDDVLDAAFDVALEWIKVTVEDEVTEEQGESKHSKKIL